MCCYLIYASKITMLNIFREPIYLDNRLNDDYGFILHKIISQIKLFSDD